MKKLLSGTLALVFAATMMAQQTPAPGTDQPPASKSGKHNKKHHGKRNKGKQQQDTSSKTNS